MKNFEIRFKYDKNAKLRRWKVMAKSKAAAEQAALRALRKVSPTARVLGVKEIVAAD